MHHTQPLNKRSETSVNIVDLKRFLETYHLSVMYKSFEGLSLDEQSTLEMHLRDTLVYVNELAAKID